MPLLQVDNPSLATPEGREALPAGPLQAARGRASVRGRVAAATLGANVSVGAYYVLEAGVKVGANTVLMQSTSACRPRSARTA